MEVKLDYQRMADTVYALSALRAIETGGERIIGRDEETALFRRFEWALAEVCVALGSVVTAMNAREGIVELDASGPLLHKTFEGAVLQSVLFDLRLTEEPPGIYTKVLRGLVYSLPYLRRN